MRIFFHAADVFPPPSSLYPPVFLFPFLSGEVLLSQRVGVDKSEVKETLFFFPFLAPGGEFPRFCLYGLTPYS